LQVIDIFVEFFWCPWPDPERGRKLLWIQAGCQFGYRLYPHSYSQIQIWRIMNFEVELAELQNQLAETDYAEAIRQMRRDPARTYSYLLLKRLLLHQNKDGRQQEP
jgi:hypothetical protein